MLRTRTASVGFTYDAAGRPKTLTLPDGIVQTYGYDDASEVTSISYTKGATTLGDLAYGYDAGGRRTALWGSYRRTGLPAATTATASYNANNQLTSWNGTTPSYDRTATSRATVRRRSHGTTGTSYRPRAPVRTSWIS